MQMENKRKQESFTLQKKEVHAATWMKLEDTNAQRSKSVVGEGPRLCDPTRVRALEEPAPQRQEADAGAGRGRGWEGVVRGGRVCNGSMLGQRSMNQSKMQNIHVVEYYSAIKMMKY